MKAEGIFAVVGMPYSGSTLLSFIVGCHSQVFNGADLHHLNPEKRSVCSMHKENCGVLTPEVLENIYKNFDNCDEWYDSIAEAVGCPYVFDASKQLSFFQQVLPKTKKNVVIISLSKHPIRAVSSDLLNRFFDRQLKMKDLKDIKQYMEDNKSEVSEFIEKRLSAILKDVEGRRELLASVYNKKNIVKIIDLKYEDYIEAPDRVIPEIMRPFQLEYEDAFLDYANFEHHPITGNMAPIWKAKGSENKHDSDSKNFRKDFYMKQKSSVVVDDKYKEIFSNQDIEWIESQPSYKKLLRELGYKSMVSSSPWQRIKNIFVEG